MRCTRWYCIVHTWIKATLSWVEQSYNIISIWDTVYTICVDHKYLIGTLERLALSCVESFTMHPYMHWIPHSLCKSKLAIMDYSNPGTSVFLYKRNYWRTRTLIHHCVLLTFIVHWLHFKKLLYKNQIKAAPIGEDWQKSDSYQIIVHVPKLDGQSIRKEVRSKTESSHKCQDGKLTVKSECAREGGWFCLIRLVMTEIRQLKCLQRNKRRKMRPAVMFCTQPLLAHPQPHANQKQIIW